MQLSGTEFRALHEALQNAFPTHIALARLLRMRLDVTYEEIVGANANLADAIFEVIRWAEAQGRVPNLVKGAQLENPNNPSLHDFVKESGGPAQSGQVDIDIALRVIQLADRLGVLGSLIAFACGGSGDISLLQCRLTSATAGATADEVRRELFALALTYDRIRATEPASWNRTHHLEQVVSHMQVLALAATPFLREFMSSASPGARLVAVTTLKESPVTLHAEWLADRLRTEARFLGYHAAVALRALARECPPDERMEVRNALLRARGSIENVSDGNDRARVIKEALTFLSDAETQRRGT